MSAGVNRILRYLVLAAVLGFGSSTAAADDDARTCSDIAASHGTNDAAEVISRLCDRNPGNKLALMVNVLILKFLYDRSQPREREVAGLEPKAGDAKLLRVSDQ